MTRDDIIRLALDSGAFKEAFNWYAFDEEEILRFASLVAAHEREECAKACEARNARQDPTGKTRVLRWEADQCARAIRARSNDEN